MKITKERLREIIMEEYQKLNEVSLPSGWKQVNKAKWRHDGSKFNVYVEKTKWGNITAFDVVGKTDGYPATNMEDGLANESDAIKLAQDLIKHDYPKGAQGR